MKYLLPFYIFLLLLSCEKQDAACDSTDFLADQEERNFRMGFTTWPYAPSNESVDETYDFISNNGDIYAEHIDEYVPWRSLLEGTEYPDDYKDKMNFKALKRPSNIPLSLSVSILNSERSAIIKDRDGYFPENFSFDSEEVIDAYYRHLEYLIAKLSPDYLVFAIEVNELLLKSSSQWEEYKVLSNQIRLKLRQNYPDLPISESITLHNYFRPEIENVDAFRNEIKAFMAGQDFAAVSFYPFMKGLSAATGFQEAFNFLHTNVDLPIAFVETSHIAETLDIEAFDLHIPSDECDQKRYLESLLENAAKKDYLFVIWWSHRDFDELWETFPEDVKDLGKIWRDTGLLNEDGEKRGAFESWQKAFEL